MNRFLLFLLLFLAGCNNDSEPDKELCADNITATFEPCSNEQTVTANQCILLEAAIRDASGNVIDRFVYHHDGTNYNQIDRYYVDSSEPDPDTPTEVIKLTYQGGVVSQVTRSERLSPGTTWVTTFTHEGHVLTGHLDIFEDGSLLLAMDITDFYVSATKDSVYFYDGPITNGYDARTLYELKGGNMTRRGGPSDEGICTSHGLTWTFRKNFFDDRPNVLTDYAVRYPFIEGKGIYGLMPEAYVQANANNIIGRAGNDGLNDGTSPFCWTFLKNAGQMYWIKEFRAVDRPNGNITYYYDCE